MSEAGWQSAAEVVRRAAGLEDRRGRVILGIAGAPGAGKSTLAEWIVEELNHAGLNAVWVPMDGFHFADAALDALDRRDRKGAIDTFDVDGYHALLTRIRADADETIYAPSFDRTIEQPIAGSIAIPPTTEVVVSEGNYLLSDGWEQVRHEFTEVWFVSLDDQLRIERLIDRHIEFGKTPGAAVAWVDAVDNPNATMIANTMDRADITIHLPLE